LFEVYTREAERVLNEALQKAVEHEGDWIVAGSEMIVLAMLDGPPDPDDLARRALDAHAVTADGFVGWLRVSSSEEARAEAKRVGTLPGPFSSPETNLCLRRALQLALEEGTRVGTEHLLLGVLYERDSFASIGLRELSFTYEDAFRTIELEKRDRRRVGAVAHEPPVLIPDPPQRTTRGAAVLPELARQVAEDDPAASGRLATHHYLLAVAMEGETGDPGGLAGRVLRSFGLSYPVLEARARELSAPERGGLGSDDPDLVSQPPDWPLMVDDPT
jgi:hypothetical protein